ncbi:tyrosine-type recombinase/integrase [Sphingobium sp. LSP13-1-1.1]|uniref:tyrosine-type recombinase/integrase n=1 Tax=Sphingobium sp. LSP13-1-1.1 TaxID=3135234 RepID=UPI0034214EA6
MKAPILTDAQWNKIALHVETMKRPEHYRLLLVLVRKLGLRPMELAGLESSWFRGGELRIPLGHSKGGSGRSLPVSADILDAVYLHMGERKGRVFLNREGYPFSAHQMSASVRRLMGMAGVEGSAYSGRRGMATRMVEQGASMRVLQKALGHRHLQTTMAYAEVSDSMLRQALFG